MNGSTCGTPKGFTFIEILIVLLIVALFISIAAPRLRIRGTDRIDETIEQLNRLTRAAFVRAIVTGKVHRVVISMGEPAEMRLEVATEQDGAGQRTFELAKPVITDTRYTWDSAISIKNLYIKTIDEARGGLQKAWFFVMPIGISQEIIINLVDDENRQQRGIVLNPFSVKFTVYDEFQAP